MKTFKEFSIEADHDLLTEFVTKLQNMNFDNYTYDSEKALNYAKMIGRNSNEVLTFKSPEIKNAIAYIWLVVDGNNIKITNITPHVSGQLRIDQYNAILDDFYLHIIKPNIDDQYAVKITSDSKSIQEYAGIETAKKLEKWISLANKSTLITNNYDFDRWTDFIITAHRNNTNLNPIQLEKYLIVDIGISDENLVNQVVNLYDFGRILLVEYDKQK